MASETYRDGKVHVLSEKCSTCVFRPGNLMTLPPGRMKELVETNRENDVAFACHQTIMYPTRDDAAICRGYFDRFKDEVTPLILAQALDVVVEQDPPGR